MLYSEGIFRTSTPEGSISSNPERTAPRRRGVELGYIGVLQKRADSRNIKLFRSLRPSGILISLRRGGPGAFVYSLAGPEETEAQRKNRLVWNAQSVVELKPGLQLPQLQPMPSLRVLRCWWVDTMGCSQVWAAEVKTSLVAAWKRATSYPRGIICQMNRNISDFHLLWANFSRERWVDFLKPYAGRFHSVLFLRSWQQSWLSIPDLWELQRIQCRVFLWIQILKHQQNLGAVEWNGDAWWAAPAPKSTSASSRWADRQSEDSEKPFMGLLLLRWVRRERGSEVCWEWVTNHVPARFPQLWGILFININYQLPIWAWQVPWVYKQNTHNNFIAGIHWSGAFVYSPGSSYNAHLCDKWVGCGACWENSLTHTFINKFRIEKNYSGTSQICSGSFILVECLSSLIGSIHPGSNTTPHLHHP